MIIYSCFLISALERSLKDTAGKYCYGDEVGIYLFIYIFVYLLYIICKWIVERFVNAKYYTVYI